MRLGFTGTRNGLTPSQDRALFDLLESLPISEAHHGDCVGADAEFHKILDGVVPIIGHLPIDDSLRAFCEFRSTREPKRHFERNRDIVNETDALIVCPMQDAWQPRGGTWYTHDYAKKQGKQIWIVWPTGVTQHIPPRLVTA